MCGVIGLYLKDKSLHARLGSLFAPMLLEMTERGPDSAGVAVYREDPLKRNKLTVYSAAEDISWADLASDLEKHSGVHVQFQQCSSHATLSADMGISIMRSWVEKNRPDIKIMSSGSALEIYKEKGLPKNVLKQFNVASMAGSHMIGHTRMATESSVSTAGAHPFSTGEDVCLVHNGSLSNHNELRRRLENDAEISFQTDNDSEVAAGYLANQLSRGSDLRGALEAAIKDLDGFYTFAVGTRDGFAVLRDPIACKPAILAETEQWVAMGSEFRAFTNLPNIERARVWEPEPGVIYHWKNAQ